MYYYYEDMIGYDLKFMMGFWYLISLVGVNCIVSIVCSGTHWG
jgi:hypothetical protein